MKMYNLFGECHLYVSDMAKEYLNNGWGIATVAIEKGNVLIHCYFEKNGTFIDSRNALFFSKDELLKEFNINGKKKPYLVYRKFNDVSSFKRYVVDLVGNGKNFVTKYDEELDEYYSVPIFVE